MATTIFSQQYYRIFFNIATLEYFMFVSLASFYTALMNRCTRAWGEAVKQEKDTVPKQKVTACKPHLRPSTNPFP